MGIFYGYSEFEQNGDLPDWWRAWLQDTIDWFNRHLPVPRVSQLDQSAIFWFDPHSIFVQEMWQLVALLREEGVFVCLRRTRRPGRIVYRDDYQIAAIPYGRDRS